MTREEAIKNREECVKYLEGIGTLASPKCLEAVRMSVVALKAQQDPAKLDRSRWDGCWSCNNQKVRNLGLRHGQEYCPCCGKPLTGQAWAELERKIGGNDGTAD